MSESEFKKRIIVATEITQKECNYSCRLDDEKFPKPNRQESYVKLIDIDDAKKEFPLLTPELEKEFPTLWPLRLNEQRADWFKKWFGDASKVRL